MNILVSKKRNQYFILIIILLLSGYVHLWNPTGFPDIFFDEGVYLRRAMHVIDGLGPQEAYLYDHPFFGQIILSGFLGIIGFPNSLPLSNDPNSIEMLYLIPRILMGILAVIDTFLVFKITEKQFGYKTAVLSSILFSVMPITWILRRILLDSLLLPFLLTSVLLAIYFRDSNKTYLLFFSGITLGLAVFTKIPVVLLIPFVAYMIYSSRKNIKDLGLWLIPVVLIPLLWPVYAISVDQFDLWVRDVFWQTQRGGGGLPYLIDTFFNIDPILFLFGFAGLIYAIVKKNIFVLLWILPLLLFFALVGYTQYFYIIPILPAFCIASSIMIMKLSENIKLKKIRIILPIVWILSVGIFGFISTAVIISTNMTQAQFETASFVLNNVNDQDTTILASPIYSWIFHYVFEKDNVLIDYSLILFEPVQTEKILLVADPHFKLDINRGQPLQNVYDDTNKIIEFKGNLENIDTSSYPYNSLNFNREGEVIEIKIGNNTS